jgi:hypothetical protein
MKVAFRPLLNITYYSAKPFFMVLLFKISDTGQNTTSGGWHHTAKQYHVTSQ